MEQSKERYISPFSARYASREMQEIFSEKNKFRTWRRLWIALAKAERALGLEISEEQISEMERFRDDINFEAAEAREKECRHDVMSHVYAYGLQCPKAKPIIHLGATSCYVGDNTDVILMRDAARLIETKAVQVLRNLAAFAERYKATPCLGYTHLQPAQPVTVGKRAALWMNELLTDLENLDFQVSRLRLLGQKGTTGTQASFLALFGGDGQKVDRLEELIAQEMGFDACVPVSGQTYSRKTDAYILSVLSGFAQSASKFANDLRILQSFEEVEEPFESAQIGSSAMPYKRNPMRCERMTALARYVITDALNPALTASCQWMERTLDDSANRRVAVAEAFLAVDGILDLYLNVSAGLVVNQKVIARRLAEKLPYMATENIMMESVKRGADRQEIHEIIRRYAAQASCRQKEGDGRNDLLELLANDPRIPLTSAEIAAHADPAAYIGRSVAQTEDFLKNVVAPFLRAHDFAPVTAELSV